MYKRQVLDILFKLADDRGLLLLDLEDFRALLALICLLYTSRCV